MADDMEEGEKANPLRAEPVPAYLLMRLSNLAAEVSAGAPPHDDEPRLQAEAAFSQAAQAATATIVVALAELRDAAKAVSAFEHPNDRDDVTRSKWFHAIQASTLTAVRVFLAGDDYGTPEETPREVLTALTCAERLLAWAEDFALHADRSGRGASFLSPQEHEELQSRLHAVYELLYAKSRIRSDLQFEAMKVIEVYADTDPWRRWWASGGRYPGFEEFSDFEDHVGILLVHDVEILAPPSPSVTEVIAKPALLELISKARDAIRLWPQKAGRPPKGQLSKFEAANRFLHAMGIGAESAEALEKTWRTNRKRAK